MLVCSNCVVRLSPLVCKYFATCSLSSKSWLSSSKFLGNSIRTNVLNSSQSNTITGTLIFDLHYNNLPFFLVFSLSHSRSFHTSTKRDKKDYYEVLGIPKTANAKDIKKAYYSVCFFSYLLIQNDVFARI